jgi:hypothetical protein
LPALAQLLQSSYEIRTLIADDHSAVRCGMAAGRNRRQIAAAIVLKETQLKNKM